MAVCTLNFTSSQLKKNTEIVVCLPDSCRIGDGNLSGRKVVWLLHGLSDDDTAWLRYSRIDKYCMERGLVAVMPDGDRSFYADDFHGQNYFRYITEELPDYLEKVFGLSRRREDNFICGLSMGGYGALRMALTYPERYAAVGSFSGVADLSVLLAAAGTEERMHDFAFLAERIPDPAHSEYNPVCLLDPEKDRDLRIFVSCGLEDDLLPLNKLFEARCAALGIRAHWEFVHGTHEWGLWDRMAEAFLDFALSGDYE